MNKDRFSAIAEEMTPDTSFRMIRLTIETQTRNGAYKFDAFIRDNTETIDDLFERAKAVTIIRTEQP